MINFLLQTEIIPLCLRIMETGSSLARRWPLYCSKDLLDQVELHVPRLSGSMRFHRCYNMVESLVKEPLHDYSSIL